MRVLAYCCRSFVFSAVQAAGVQPHTCPPTTSATFDPRWLEGRDLLYFDLHGEPGEALWRGDDGVIALTATQILEADLGRSIVFAANCHLADEDSPMLEALLDAGARYVIGGDGKNWGGQRALFGATLLGYAFRQAMAMGVEPLQALTWAKRRVKLDLTVEKYLRRRPQQQLAAEDTLAFRAYYRRI